MIQHIILGLIQGITEFLPVSSSGHLVVAKALLGLESPGAALEIALHLATGLAVVIYLFREFRLLLDWRYAAKIVLGLAPAALVGILFQDPLEQMFGNPLPVGFLFVATGALLLSTRWAKPRGKPLTWTKAIIIGLCQVLALLPGVSRSGTTIAVGLFLGLAPEEAFRFSFFMLLPAVVGGALLDAGDIAHLPNPPGVIAGFLTALIAGVLSLYFLKRTLVSRKFFWFSFYLFGVGALSILVFMGSHW